MASTKNRQPRQGEVWLFDPDPVRGNEIGKKIRPCLIISCDLLNQGPSGLVIVLPMTSVERKIPSRIALVPPEGGLNQISYVIPEQIRSISKDRLIKHCGAVRSQPLLHEIYSWVHDFLRFY